MPEREEVGKCWGCHCHAESPGQIRHRRTSLRQQQHGCLKDVCSCSKTNYPLRSSLHRVRDIWVVQHGTKKDQWTQDGTKKSRRELKNEVRLGKMRRVLHNQAKCVEQRDSWHHSNESTQHQACCENQTFQRRNMNGIGIIDSARSQP